MLESSQKSSENQRSFLPLTGIVWLLAWLTAHIPRGLGVGSRGRILYTHTLGPTPELFQSTWSDLRICTFKCLPSDLMIDHIQYPINTPGIPYQLSLGFLRWRQWDRTHLPMQETQETPVQSLSHEDPLEEGMATHSIVLARKIPWTEEPDGLYSSWGHKDEDMNEAT